MGQIKTLYVMLYRAGKIVHTLSVRSDWTDADWDAVRTEFPGTYTKSKSTTMPVFFLGKKGHYTDFAGMKKYAHGSK